MDGQTQLAEGLFFTVLVYGSWLHLLYLESLLNRCSISRTNEWWCWWVYT